MDTSVRCRCGDAQPWLIRMGKHYFYYVNAQDICFGWKRIQDRRHRRGYNGLVSENLHGESGQTRHMPAVRLVVYAQFLEMQTHVECFLFLQYLFDRNSTG